MRRSLPILLIAVLVLGLGTPAFAANSRGEAMAYIMAKYEVPEDHIQLFEGGTLQLEYTGEFFWYAKYIVGLKRRPESGETRPGSDDPKSTVAEPKPAILPAPDTRPAILPLPPQDLPDEDVIYGAIYIRLKTGQVLDMDEAQEYFIADREAAVREWERLCSEAGKLDVSLYLRLKELPSGEKVTVWLYPAHVITEDIRSQFAALMAKYPGIGEGLSLDDLFMSFGTLCTFGDLPVCNDGACEVPELTPETRLVPGDTPGSVTPGGSGVSGSVVEPLVKPERPEPDIFYPDIQRDDEYWRIYTEFWAGVEGIRVQAVAHSMTGIKAALDGIGVTYSEEGACLVADLTAEQVRLVAELSSVAGVCEETIFTTMENATLMLRGSLDSAGAAAPPSGAQTKNAAAAAVAAAANSPAGYATAVLLIGALMAYGLRTVRGRGRQ